jgi:hypothetical protein
MRLANQLLVALTPGKVARRGRDGEKEGKRKKKREKKKYKPCPTPRK